MTQTKGCLSLSQMSWKQKFTISYILIFVYAIILKLPYGLTFVDQYPTSMYAVNYFDVGFLRRCIPGTILKLISFIFPNAYTYSAVFILSSIITLIFVGLLYLAIIQAIDKLENKQFVCIFGSICSLFLVTSYIGSNLFGMPDIYVLVFAMLQYFVLVKQKHEWLIIPLSFLGVCTHESYLCMLAPFTVVILMYRFIKTKKSKYLIIWILHFVAISGLAVYFLKFSPHSLDKLPAVNEVYSKITNLNTNYQGLIYRILNATQAELDSVDGELFNMYQHMGLVQLAIFIPLCFPYIYNWVRSSNKKVNIITLIGLALISVNFILFIDYGRYMAWIVFFLFTTIMSMFYFQDKPYEQFCAKTVEQKNNIFSYFFVAIYTVFLCPFTCNGIDLLTHGIANLFSL